MNAIFFNKGGEEKNDGARSVCSRQKSHCALKLYIHIRNLKPPSHREQDSCNCEQDNVTFQSVFLSTDKQETVTNPTFGLSFLNKAMDYQLCGLRTLGHAFPRWSGAGGKACWRRFALLNILSDTSHLDVSGLLEGTRCPLLNLLMYYSCMCTRLLHKQMQTRLSPVCNWNRSIQKSFRFENYINHTEGRGTFCFVLGFFFCLFYFLACGALKQPAAQSWENQIWGKRQNIRRKRP